MLIDALKLRDLQKDAVKPIEDPFRSLLKILKTSPKMHDFSTHALAVIRTRLAMMLLPKLPETASYNGRHKIIVKHLTAMGLNYSEDYDEDDVDEIMIITNNIREAGEDRNKKSWNDLHYLHQHRLLDAQNSRCKLCGCVLKLGIGSSSPKQPALDHVVPFDLGGNKDNVRLICRGCNTAKGQNLTFVNSDRVALNYFIKASSENEIRLWVMERDESSCTEPDCCNDSRNSVLEVILINPLGRYIFDNLRTVCESCYNPEK